MQVYDIVLDKNRKETTRHGSFDFPIAIYTTEVSRNVLGYVAWHWHDELQFSVVMDGELDFYINSDIVTLSKGEGIFINAGQMHQVKNRKGKEGTYICIDFHHNMISGFSGSCVNAKYVAPNMKADAPSYTVLRQDNKWQMLILEKLSELYGEYNKEENIYEIQIQIFLLEIWKIMVKEFFGADLDEKFGIWDPRIKKMIEYINEHYMESLKLESLAEELNLSKSACCREFKKYVKCTIFEYLLDYRITEATNLLINSNESITGIAYRCGFGSSSYFIEKFKKKSGISPLAYRKKYCFSLAMELTPSDNI